MRQAYSEEFGRLMSALLDARGLSLQRAEVIVGGRVSRTYWGQMRAGKVPSYDVLLVVLDAFGDEAVPLFKAAGYEAPTPQSVLDRLNLALAEIGRDRGWEVQQVIDNLIEETRQKARRRKRGSQRDHVGPGM